MLVYKPLGYPSLLHLRISISPTKELKGRARMTITKYICQPYTLIFASCKGAARMNSLYRNIQTEAVA